MIELSYGWALIWAGVTVWLFLMVVIALILGVPGRR